MEFTLAAQRHGIGQGMDPLSVELGVGGAAPLGLDTPSQESQVGVDQICLPLHRGSVKRELHIGGTAPFSLEMASGESQIAIAQVRLPLEGGEVRGRSEEHTSELQSPMYL